MYKRLFLFLVLGGFLFCFFCQSPLYVNHKNDIIVSKSNLVDTLKQFRKFLSKFKMLSYPFNANTSCYDPDTSISQALDMDNDSIFLDFCGPAMSIGILPDTLCFYTLLWCSAGNCYLPTLTTYTKNGKIISSSFVANGCGSGEGYYCSDTLIVCSLHNIMTVFTEEYDSAGLRKKNVTTKNFSVGKNGVISVIKDVMEE